MVAAQQQHLHGILQAALDSGLTSTSKSGRYSVHSNFGVSKVKYQRLTGVGVINSSEYIGFQSFDDFKSFFGRAGKGYEWHHLVEQTTYKDRFPERVLHSTGNIVRIRVKNHKAISDFYSTKYAGHSRYRDFLLKTHPKHDYFKLRQIGIEHMTNPEIGDWQFWEQGTFNNEAQYDVNQSNDKEARSERD